MEDKGLIRAYLLPVGVGNGADKSTWSKPYNKVPLNQNTELKKAKRLHISG